MSSLKNIITLILAAFFSTTSAIAAGEEHAVSVKAEALFEIPLWDGFSLSITNSIVTAWLVGIGLVILIRVCIGKPKLVPGKAQLIFEDALALFKEMFEPILGKKAFPATFPLLVCFFFFILVQNWAGLLPGVGTITFGGNPIFRPLGADMNGTVALALVSFGAWFIIVLRFAGLKFVLHDWFGNKADRRDVPVVVYYFLSLIFFLVGFIEIVSVIFRPVSLSFRLYGNVFGGETLMHSTGYFTAFYFLELIIGLVQALVFTLLSAVYIGLLTNHETGEHAEEDVPAK